MNWLNLLKENSSLRRLWLAQLISSVGDWFSYVAIIALVMDLTGSGLKVALAILCRTVPVLLLGPWAGVLADRLNKKWVMIGTDLARAGIVVGYLGVNRAEDLWLVYLLSAVSSVGTVFFDSTRLAYLPQIINKDQLLIANSIYSFTFGLTIALGALLGGWTISLLGYGTAFLFNSASFLLSAYLLWKIKTVNKEACKKATIFWAKEVWLTCRWLYSNPLILLLILADASLAVGSGLMNVLLGIFALKVFAGGSLGLGILYNSLGLGFVLGSLFTNKIKVEGIKEKFLFSTWMLMGIGTSLIFFSQSPSLLIASFLIIFTYFFQGIFGIFYNTLLMLLIPADIQGKVFALDRTKLLTVMSSTVCLAGWFLETFSAREVGLGTGIFVLLAGLFWVVIFNKLLLKDWSREKQNGIISL